MFGRVFKNSFIILGKKPFLLIGLSLMYSLICGLANIICIPFVVLGIAACLVLAVGMAGVFVNGYQGNKISSENLFSGFSKFGRNAGGMGWRALWFIIWGLIPIAGPIIVIVKSYSYSFVTYILSEDKKITATSALKKSMELTKGHKGKLFLADLAFIGISLVMFLIIFGLMAITFDTDIIIFAILGGLIGVIYLILMPFFTKLVKAGFYEEIKTEKGYTPEGTIEA